MSAISTTKAFLFVTFSLACFSLGMTISALVAKHALEQISIAANEKMQQLQIPDAAIQIINDSQTGLFQAYSTMITVCATITSLLAVGTVLLYWKLRRESPSEQDPQKWKKIAKIFALFLMATGLGVLAGNSLTNHVMDQADLRDTINNHLIEKYSVPPIPQPFIIAFITHMTELYMNPFQDAFLGAVNSMQTIGGITLAGGLGVRLLSSVI